MNNNGWIKYSEEKPKIHGEYLVVADNHCDVLPYITQDDIDDYMAKDKEGTSESCYLCNFAWAGLCFDKEGFYDWCDGSDGFGLWMMVDVKYWQPLPELPTE